MGWADRIAIVGPNGSGKTTLLLALLGRLPLTTGSRFLGPAVVIGEMDQARHSFEGDTSLYPDARLALISKKDHPRLAERLRGTVVWESGDALLVWR